MTADPTYDPNISCVWIATTHHILKIDVNKEVRLITKYPKKGKTTGMCSVKQKLWFISGNTLYALRKNDGMIRAHSDTSYHLQSISSFENGKVIVAGNHLYKVVHDTLQQIYIKEDKNNEVIQSLVCDHDDNIYFTRKRQLVKYNLIDKTLKIYDSNVGLPNEGLSYIIYDDTSHLWICTRASGLCRFNIKDESIKYFKEGDGLVDNVYLFGLSTVKKGIIAAYRWQFFSYYQPKSKNNLLMDFPFLFENILINKEDQTQEVLKSGKIIVPSLNSLISMDITYPSHLNPQEYALQYRLKSERDTIWSEIGEDHKLIISQLAPGEYNLELKATNTQHPEDNVVNALSILSLSPFYMRWWFFALLTLTSYFIMFLIYRYKKIQRKKIEYLRSSISKDLHDEMGSNLSSIMLLGEMALIKKDNLPKTMLQIVEKTKFVMQSMSDIVWSINPGNDSLPNIIQKIQTTCLDVLEPADINISFNISDDVKNASLEMAKRQAFYMIFKEAINNCAKYSKAKNVKLTIHIQRSTILASFEDDGIGFNLDTVKRGNGLRNISQRAVVIGGHAVIQSSPSGGTKISVSIPAD